jgi:putative ABC transport system substrate-binding protein
MKKLTSLLLIVALIICSLTTLTACEGENDQIKVGVIQFMSHASLDNCYEGIEQALTASGMDIKIDRQIGSSNSAVSDCDTFARNMVAADYDVIIAIATPAAASAFAATNGTDIPVIFCAVSDPVIAKLVDSLEVPGDLCTGTADVLDLEKQVTLIQTLQPDVKSIGVLYTSSEANSISNLERFKEICGNKGLSVIAEAVQNASDIPAAAEKVASSVDCINNFTDNNVVENLEIVLTAADKYEIPVYGSEVEQVEKGCVASATIDYIAVGYASGEMAIQVLNGADASTMAVKEIKDASIVLNKEVMDTLGLTYPDENATYVDAQTNE